MKAFAYSEVTGYLIIHDDGTDPISNLDGLSALTSVGGVLDIFNNPLLTNLDGLSFLASVGGGLDIGFNAVLANVNGLSALTSLGWDLVILGNAALANLDGLSSLTSVGRDLFIEYNAVLTNLDGLSSLISVGGGLFIESNASLDRFCGLYSLLQPPGGLVGNYDVSGNAANPTAVQIVNGGPCGPADKIQELVDEGILNRGLANSLNKQAGRNLNALANHLIALVNAGILSEAQAQVILVLASL